MNNKRKKNKNKNLTSLQARMRGAEGVQDWFPWS
jgi:hypothetical protein